MCRTQIHVSLASFHATRRSARKSREGTRFSRQRSLFSRHSVALPAVRARFLRHADRYSRQTARESRRSSGNRGDVLDSGGSLPLSCGEGKILRQAAIYSRRPSEDCGTLTRSCDVGQKVAAAFHILRLGGEQSRHPAGKLRRLENPSGAPTGNRGRVPNIRGALPDICGGPPESCGGPPESCGGLHKVAADCHLPWRAGRLLRPGSNKSRRCAR